MMALIRVLFERVTFERILALPFGLVYRILFRHVGAQSFVSPFIQCLGLDCITLGSRSRIHKNTRLLALKSYGDQSFSPSIKIGDDVSVGFGCTLSCINQIHIGSDVTIGDNVYIADSHHEYRNPLLGVLAQPLIKGAVTIGDKAWIGYGAFIAGNISIGEHSVVGANSVVTHSVPPFTIVAGVPARPIKRFCHQSECWVNINTETP
jgi:acetyltransferase-like isoleucine patch superfamily enzyme